MLLRYRWLSLAERASVQHVGRCRESSTGGSAPSNPHTGVDASVTRIKDRRLRGRWTDSLRVMCYGGHGGNGLAKYGGIGGKGGDVYIQADGAMSKTPNLYSIFSEVFQASRSKQLCHYVSAASKSCKTEFARYFQRDPKKQCLRAKPGKHSSRLCILGEFGDDVTLKVPPGVTIADDYGNIKYDLNQPGDRVKVASGGQGGGPNTQWFGMKGEHRPVRLDLKLIADLGLVGFPNAGKSTLLKAISRAKPKIASYPFTTIRPNIGHLCFQDERVIAMADLPGLIEGAHYNIGMGHRFLKHVERTKMLIFVVDIQGFQLHTTSVRRTAFETIILLNRELELYNPELVRKPCLCLINKMDTYRAKETLDDLEDKLTKDYEASLSQVAEELRPEQRISFSEIIPMSAKFGGKTVAFAKGRIRHWLDHFDDEERLRAESSGELSRRISDLKNVNELQGSSVT